MTQGPPWQPPQAPGAPPPWQAQAPAPPPQAAPWQPQPAPQAAPAWAPPAAPPQAAPPAWTPPMAPAPQAAPPAWGPPPPAAAPQWAPAPYAAPAAAPPGYGPPPAAPQWGAPVVNPFEGIGEAEVFTKTPYFPPNCDFVVELAELKGVVSKNPQKLGHVMIVVECKVLQTNAPGVLPGAAYAQTFDLNGYGKPDMNAVLTALHGGQPGNKEWTAHLAAQGVYSTPKIMEYIGPSQPLRGRKMTLRTVETPSRKTPGKIFTKHYWGPVA